MASSSHDLPATSCQETLNLICHEKTNSGCHSKSFSALPCSGPGGPERKPEIHKSLNSILCVSKCNEKSILQSHSSEWSPIQDAVPDLCPVKADCNHLSVDYVQQRIQHRNHYRSADSSLATAAEQEVTMNFVRCNVSENISLLGHSETAVCTAEGVDNLDTTSMMVQKSYSDYFCGSRTSVPSSVREHNKNSAIYSNLSSSSSISGSGSDGTCTLSNVTQDSGIVYSPSTVQNNLTDVMSPVREQSIPLCHLDSSTIQHNITVYTVPGTYQHGVLGPRNSGNGFPNNGHMYSQSHYSIPGVMSCDNISDTKLLPPAMIIHNSCSMHCCKGHEPMMKVDDTIAAYCHSLPIPSVQFSSGLVHSLDKPVSGHIPPEFCYQLQPSDKFAIPKLVSSVSESGLDAKKLIKCGRLAFPQSPVSTGELHLNTSLQGNNDLLLKTSRDDLEIPDSGAKMKDNWTMTSMNYLSMEHKIPLNCKDAEVQTIIIMENKAVSTSPCPQTMGHSHLFPEVGLGLNLQCPQTPIREVRWDNEGMTWEVYGAAVDPEVLGSAIQKHLEIQIEQHLQPSELSEEMEQSTKEKRRSLRTVMQSLRQSNCCVRTNSTSE